MRHAHIFLAIFALSVVSTTARADIVADGPWVAPHSDLALLSVDWRAGASAPAPDTEAVTSDVRNGLSSAEERIERCIDGADLREDPLRSRARRLTVVFRFSRSGTPRVSIERSTMPGVVRGCILEAARSIRASTAPRGDVTVRAVFELR